MTADARHLKPHPLAEIFPLIEGQAFEELVDDIRQNGCRDEIVLYEGKILDGRNRYRALERLVEEGHFEADCLDPDVSWDYVRLEEDYPNESALAYVISKNLKRRHLSESQRALVAARLANLTRGGDRRSDQTANLQFDPEARAEAPSSAPCGAPSPTRGEGDETVGSQRAATLSPQAGRGDGGEGLTRGEAAALLNVSERSVNTARSVVERGVASLVARVERGGLSVSAASAIATLAPQEQEAIVATGEKEIKAKAKEIRAREQAAKKDRRVEREAELGRRQMALPDRRYGVIYADPPWRFQPRSGETGMDRAADNHYPTMETGDIRLLGFELVKIRAEDCALFLWATAPMLPDAFTVMASWGFEYRSHVVWKKVFPGGQKGTGYWWRNEHELLLLGVRGSPPAPAPGMQWGSVINAPVGRHSEKPGQFAQMIEAYFPTLPRIELFARTARPGWDVWGNEVSGVSDQVSEEISPTPGTCPPAPGTCPPASDPEPDIPENLRRNPDNSLTTQPMEAL